MSAPLDIEFKKQFHHLFVCSLGSCFFRNSKDTILAVVVSLAHDIDEIGQYEWEAATLAASLRGMHHIVHS